MTSVTFDPGTHIIQIDTAPVNDIVSLDVGTELYSEAKRQWLSNPALNVLRFPMRSIGGDEITATQNAGATFFLQYGWRIRPYDADHRFIVNGNLYTDPAGESPFLSTVSAATVRIESQLSNLVDSSVARLDLTQLQPAVFIDVNNGVAGTVEGIGTPTNPVNNEADARTIADRDGLRQFHFRGAITLSQSYPNWSFKGLSAEGADTVALNGQNVDGSKFDECEISGAMSGRVDCINCGFNSLSGFNGIARSCGLINTLTLAVGSRSTLHQCFSEVAGAGRPTVYCASTGDIQSFGLRAYTGGVTIEDMSGSESVSIDVIAGTVEIGASCTGGVANVRGVGIIVDNSNGTTVLKDGFIEAVDIRQTRDLAEADEKLEPNRARKYHATTGAVLLDKTVSGSNNTQTINIGNV